MRQFVLLLLLHVVCLVVVVVANNDDSLKQKGILGLEQPSSNKRQRQHRPRILLEEQEDKNEESLTLVSSMFHVTLRPTAWTMGLPAIQIVEKTTEAFLGSMLGVNNDLTNEPDAALVHLDSISAHVHEIEFHRPTNHEEDGPNTSERKQRRLLLLNHDDDTRFLKEEETEEQLDSFTTLSMSIEATFRGDLSHAPPQTSHYLDALLVYAFTSRPMATVQFRDWLSLSGNSFFHQVTAVQVALPSIHHSNQNNETNHTESDIFRPTEGSKTRRMSNLDISFMVVSAAIFLAIVAIVVTHVQQKRKTHSEQVSYFETNPHASRGTGRHDVMTLSLPPPSLTCGSEGNLSLRQFAMESSISSIHGSSPSPTCLRNASNLGLRLDDLRDPELHCHLGPMQHYQNEDTSVVIVEDCNQVFPSQWSDVDLDAPVSQSVGSSMDTLDVFDVGHDPEDLKSCRDVSPNIKQPLSRKGGALGDAANWLEWTKSIRVVEIYRGETTSEGTTSSPLSSGHDGNC